MKYSIKSVHEIFVDSYENGEMELAGYYTSESEIKANNIKEAIQKYFDNVLYYKFDFEKCSISDDEKVLYYSVLCDAESIEANQSEIDLWKKNELALFSNNIEVEVFEMVKCEITI